MAACNGPAVRASGRWKGGTPMRMLTRPGVVGGLIALRCPC